MQVRDEFDGSGTLKQPATPSSEVNDEDDWLESDDENATRNDMGARDSKKVQGKLFDEGYRVGITTGKESMVQVGFDSAYNEKGAPLGRQYGNLLGSITALCRYASKRNSDRMEDLKALLSAIKALQVTDLAEPDWEAIEHEREHGADVSHIKRESKEEKPIREQRLHDLQEQVNKFTYEIVTVEIS